jgi:hypothetical protein
MPWAISLQSLNISCDNFNPNLYKAAFDAFENLRHLKLKMAFQFPQFLSYLFKRFVNEDGIQINAAPGLFGLARSRDMEQKDKALVPRAFRPVTTLSLKYIHHYNT